MKMKSKLTSIMALLLLGSFTAAAQGYDDDDIYYNPSKAPKKETVKKTDAPATASGNGYSYSYTYSGAADVPAADTYTPAPSAGIAMDVDAYNRRGIFGSGSSTAADSSAKAAQHESFGCTQQIERFYNPRVVIESPDDDLARVYYSQPETTTDINIYVNAGTDFWGPGYYSPWSWGTPRSWWYYNSWAYNPWSWSYGPSWSWTWGPSWSWGWGGYYPAYYPGYWNPGYYPGYWNPIYHPVRPNYANRPGGNSRPAYRPGQSAGRHSATSTGTYGNSRPSYRPSSGSARPSSGSAYRPGQSSGTSSGSSNSGYRSGSSRRSDSSPSYRSSGSSNRSSSSPSYRSGGSSRSSGGFSGGGSSRGGGGGSRGGRH